MVVVWADASVLSTGKTKTSGAIASLNSLEPLHMAARTERTERTDAAMAKAIPFPHTPVPLIEVYAPRNRIAPILITAGIPLLAGKQPDFFLRRHDSSTKRPLCVLPSTSRNSGIIIHISQESTAESPHQVKRRASCAEHKIS